MLMIIEAEKSDLEPFALLAKQKGVAFRYSGSLLGHRKKKRVNNFSPSGDIWFDDPENIAVIEEGLQDIRNGRYTTFKTKEELHDFLDGL